MQKIIIIPENPNSEPRIPNSEPRTPNPELRTPNSESRTPNSESRFIRVTFDPKSRFLALAIFWECTRYSRTHKKRLFGNCLFWQWRKSRGGSRTAPTPQPFFQPFDRRLPSLSRYRAGSGEGGETHLPISKSN